MASELYEIALKFIEEFGVELTDGSDLIENFMVDIDLEFDIAEEVIQRFIEDLGVTFDAENEVIQQFIKDVQNGALPGNEIPQKITEKLDAVLKNQLKPSVGIMMSRKLYTYLDNDNKIVLVPIYLMDSKTVKFLVPTYRGSFPVVLDSLCADWEFRIGLPVLN